LAGQPFQGGPGNPGVESFANIRGARSRRFSVVMFLGLAAAASRAISQCVPHSAYKRDQVRDIACGNLRDVIKENPADSDACFTSKIFDPRSHVVLDQQVLLLLNDVADAVYKLGAHFVSAVLFQSWEEGGAYIIRCKIAVVSTLCDALPATLHWQGSVRPVTHEFLYVKKISGKADNVNFLIEPPQGGSLGNLERLI
jgi:hypothetical protein